MFKKLALVVFIMGLAAAPAGELGALTLADALAKAQASLPSHQAVKKKIEAAEASYRATAGNYFPSLDIAAQTQRDFQSGDDYSTKGYSATLSYPLFDAGRKPKRDAAELTLETQKEEFRKSLLELDYLVKNVFYTALAEKSILEERRIQEQTARTDHDVAEGRRRLGVARRSEVLQASVRLEQARFNAVQAEGALRKTLSELASLIGDGGKTGDLPDTPEGTLPASGTLPEFGSLADSVLRRPEIRQAEIALKTARANLSLSTAGFYPVVSADITYSRSDAGTAGTRMLEDKNAGISASWNIFELGKFYRKKSAEIEMTISEENIRELKRQLLLDCRKVWEDLATAIRNISLADSQLDQARQNYEQAFGEYKVGTGDILSLVQAESLLANAREQAISARLNVALAGALLEKTAGISGRLPRKPRGSGSD